MKNILFLLSILSVMGTQAQSVGKKIEQRSKQRANNRVDQGIEKGLDKVEETIGGIFKKKKKNKDNESDSSESKADKEGQTGETGGVSQGKNNNNAVQTGSDFIPGANLIFEDKFKEDAIADFPAQWNTDGSGKLITINGLEGKWLDIAHNSVVNPVLEQPLPENCTIEFDLYLQSNNGSSTPIVIFGLTQVKDILKENIYYKEKFFVKMTRYNEIHSSVEYGLRDVIGNKDDFKLLPFVNKVLHVGIAINKTRVRVYFNQKKIIDLPRALTPEMRNNFYINNGHVIPASELGVLVSNLRIASAETDARSLLIKQLMDEGKAVTSDILFDVNSDVIKPESYKIINQFGEALQANPGLKIKITGHTDSDGTAANNLTLSKKRAAAVRTYLIENYGVDQSRITTDGKGASLPVAPNTSSEGKTKNRRVEFTKIN